MNIPHSVAALLGFAKKSSNLAAGEWAVEGVMKRGKAVLIILAEDCPDKRKKHWQIWCDDQKVPCFVKGTKEEFGFMLGMSPRSVIAVTDKGLAAAIQKELTHKKGLD